MNKKCLNFKQINLNKKIKTNLAHSLLEMLHSLLK
jgi:hypothetical protein